MTKGTIIGVYLEHVITDWIQTGDNINLVPEIEVTTEEAGAIDNILPSYKIDTKHGKRVIVYLKTDILFTTKIK